MWCRPPNSNLRPAVYELVDIMSTEVQYRVLAPKGATGGSRFARKFRHCPTTWLHSWLHSFIVASRVGRSYDDKPGRSARMPSCSGCSRSQLCMAAPCRVCHHHLQEENRRVCRTSRWERGRNNPAYGRDGPPPDMCQPRSSPTNTWPVPPNRVLCNVSLAKLFHPSSSTCWVDGSAHPPGHCRPDHHQALLQ